MNPLKIGIDGQGIALLSIDLPGRPMNVLAPQLMEALGAAVERIAADTAIRGAIITSGKPGSFIAGSDLKNLVTVYDGGIDAVAGAKVSSDLSGLFRAMETSGKPFIAAINGLALGGGLELCLACHYRVLSNDPQCVVGLPEVQVGLLPGAGGTQRLPRLIGIPSALPLLLDGRHVPPTEALRLGIVHALAPADEVLVRAREWLLGSPTATQPWDDKKFRVPGGAGPMAPHAMETFALGNARTSSNTNGNYPAPLAIMSCVFEGTQVPMDTGLRIESKYFGKLLSGPVARNLMRSMFVNKGAADKLSGRPRDVPKSRVEKLGVLGAGMMGAGIAHASAKAAIRVVLLDASRELAGKGKAAVSRLESNDLEKGRTTQEQIDALLGRITTTEDYADLAGCDLVIEAVFEEREVKAGVTRQAEAVIPHDAIFGSNTSTLPIGGLARASQRPAQFIGIHFFSPAQRMPLMEIIVGEETSKATIARALDYAGQLRKTPIVVRDSPGFYTSRVFATFTHEGMCMLLDGVEPALIENAARLAGFPVGPLAVSDEVTLTLQRDIVKRTGAGLSRVSGLVGSLVIERMVDELKRPGRHVGGGFYDYPEHAPKALWPGLRQAFPPAQRQPEVARLKGRFLTIMALESARCFEEGVVSSPADADIGSVLGIGYPAWTGGTLSYIDTIGATAFVEECQRLAEAEGPRFMPSPWLIARAKAGERFHRG